MIICFTDSSSSRKSNTLGSAWMAFNLKNLSSKELEDKLFEGNIGFTSSIKIGGGEMIGILFCLEELLSNNLQNEKIILYSDSEYAIKELNPINGWWRGHVLKRFVDIKNQELITNICYKLSLFKDISLFHVKGHTGKQDLPSKGNDMVDKLARAGHRLDEGAIQEDLFDYDSFIDDVRKENINNNYFNIIYENLSK